MGFKLGGGLQHLLAPSIGSWHAWRQAATFKFKQCGLTIRSTGPIAAGRHSGYKSLAQMPTHRNGPVSSNVRRHKFTPRTQNMTQIQARAEITAEFKRRYPIKPTGNDVLVFFMKLDRESSPMLSFKFKGDKYQLIQAWLSNYVIG